MASAVDDLLVRYLGLLDEYARLRTALAARQAALYGHLARANFAAERGLRYGPDHFDGRMQASARLDWAAGVPRVVRAPDTDADAKNPLQWFGILTPMTLRQAQQEAVAAVDDLVPRLAALSSEMADVEIAVRRARKKRAKGAAGSAAGSAAAAGSTATSTASTTPPTIAATE